MLILSLVSIFRSSSWSLYCSVKVSECLISFASVALTSLIVVRDVALVAAGSYIRYKSLPAPVSFCKCEFIFLCSNSINV